MTVFKVCLDSGNRVSSYEKLNSLDEKIIETDKCYKQEKSATFVDVFGVSFIPQLVIPGLPGALPRSLLLAGLTISRPPELGRLVTNFAVKFEISSLPLYPFGIGTHQFAAGPRFSLRLSEIYFLLRKRSGSSDENLSRWLQMFRFFDVAFFSDLLFSVNYAQISAINTSVVEIGLKPGVGVEFLLSQDRNQWAGKRPSVGFWFHWGPSLFIPVYDFSARAQQEDRKVLCDIESSSSFCSKPSLLPSAWLSVDEMKFGFGLHF